jgi:RNA polymerase sigma-70 factor (ECF subfamily)
MHHVPMMSRIARRILKREDLAADAVQEALIKIHEIRTVAGNVEAWLLRAVTYRSLAARRAQLRRLRNESSAAQALAGRVAGIDPERELIRKELADRITTALRSLPPEQRVAFLLREIHGLDYLQISSAQHVPIGTVRSRLCRARQGLREQLHRLQAR